MRLRKIIDRKGNLCSLECGHQQKSRGRNHAVCKECEKEGLWLFKSWLGLYLFKTTKTKHVECMKKVSQKCQWEQMFRTSILIEYPDMVCDKCKEEIGMIKVETLN